MQVKEIYASIKFVKNLGNYQSFAAEAGVTAVVEPGDQVGEVFGSAWSTAKEQVTAQIKNLKVGGVDVG